jgi:cytochrome c biogenesis protein ResB
MPILSVGGYLAARPDLWEKLEDANGVQIEAGFDKQTKVIDASGNILARVSEDGDGFVIAEIELADEAPQPLPEQPKMRTSGWVYLMADVFGAGLMTLLYRQGVRRQWGARMAPVDPRTKIWAGFVAGAAVVGWLLGRMGKRPGRN